MLRLEEQRRFVVFLNDEQLPQPEEKESKVIFSTELEEDPWGLGPDNMDIDRIARKIHDISLKIPGLAFLEMTRGQEVDITPGSRIYLERGGHRTPAIVVDDNLARAVDIDAVGRHHEREKLMRFRRYRVRSAVLWGSRWAGDIWTGE